MYHIRFTPSGQKDFQFLKKKNQPVYKRVLTKIKSLQIQPNLGKPLVGPYKGTRSLRVGPYRILYELSGQDINIYSIKHRSDVYR